MINLLHGDCLELMETIESGSVDAIITNPHKFDGLIIFCFIFEL